MFLCTYVCECMPHVYGCPWLPEVGVRSPSFQALRTFKNRNLKWPDKNGPSKFQGGKENESKVIRICCFASARRKWVPSGRRFHLLPN